MTGLPLPDLLLLAALLVAMPVVAMAQIPLIGERTIERLAAYWSSIAMLAMLGAISWLVGTRADGLAAIGLTSLAPAPFIGWTLGLTAAGIGIIVLFRHIALLLGADESPLLRALLPRDPQERTVFALLAVTAGSAEEIAYRGYAIPVLIPAVGSLGALLVTSVVFGVLHAYQGALGMVRTSLMGAALAGGFLLSGSLLPAIAAHILIDLLAGIVLADRLLLPLVDPGVGDEHPPFREG